MEMIPAPWKVSTTGKSDSLTNCRTAWVTSGDDARIPSNSTGSWAFLMASASFLISSGLAGPKMGFFKVELAGC